MDAIVKIVPKEHWEILRKYLNSGEIVIIPEEVVKQLSKEQQDTIYGMDGDSVDYNFGGAPDIYLEIVTNPGHYFLCGIFEEEDLSDE